MIRTDLLVIGAGPFGLAMAAQAGELALDHLVVGEPLSFWKRHMPEGMLLRSGCDWHLDPLERDDFDPFLSSHGRRRDDAEPIALDLYL